MKCCTVFLLLALVTYSLSSAIPKSEEHHSNRVKDKPLSEKEHYTDDDNMIHNDDDDDDDHHEKLGHNAEYDHEAFLGRDEAHEFDELAPEESKRRLGLIYDKVDKDGDGKVTHEELEGWITYVQNKYTMDDAKSQWLHTQGRENDLEGLMNWDHYIDTTYGPPGAYEDGDDAEEMAESKERDRRRWDMADLNKDGQLDFSEYAAFLHPEDVEHMHSVFVEETLQDMDKNKDGYIDIDEYIGDIWPDDSVEAEPEWLDDERKDFADKQDKNKDGKLDKEELAGWLLPNLSHGEMEARHLIQTADKDKDGYLSKEEVLDNYDLFVGSQVTDYGEAITNHDEF